MLLFRGAMYVVQDPCHKIRCIYRSDICVHEPQPRIAANVDGAQELFRTLGISTAGRYGKGPLP